MSEKKQPLFSKFRKPKKSSCCTMEIVEESNKDEKKDEEQTRVKEDYLIKY